MKFIIDLDRTFRGHVHNVVGRDGLIPHKGKRVTFEEYCQQNNGNFAVITEDQYGKMQDDFIKSLVTGWEGITEERWYEMLEVLPPMKWRDIGHKVNCFFVCEAYFATLHSCFIRDNRDGTFWESRQDINTPPDRLYKQYTKFRESAAQITDQTA